MARCLQKKVAEALALAYVDRKRAEEADATESHDKILETRQLDRKAVRDSAQLFFDEDASRLAKDIAGLDSADEAMAKALEGLMPVPQIVLLTLAPVDEPADGDAKSAEAIDKTFRNAHDFTISPIACMNDACRYGLPAGHSDHTISVAGISDELT